MEKIKDHLSKGYTPVKLYLDDLVEIEAIFKSAFEEVSFSANGYSYESLGELREHRQQVVVHELEITGFRPYFSLKAGRMAVRLYSSSDDSAPAGIFFKLDHILTRATRKPIVLYSYPIIFFGMFLVYLLDFLLMKNPRAVFFGVAAIISPWILWAAIIRFRRSGLVILEYKAKHQTFFTRNFDQLAVNSIVAIGSLIIGALAATYGHNILASFVQPLK